MGSALSSCLETGASFRGSSASAAGSEILPPASELSDCVLASGADTVVVSSMAALEMAVAAAPAGRQILVAPGTYGVSTISLHGNGAEDKPVVIRPENGLGTVIINEPRWNFSDNSSWLVVKEFYFGGSRIVLQGDHNRISRCRFRNINVRASIVTQAARDCRIDHCDFSDLTNHVSCIHIRPEHFAKGTARKLLIDYCNFHDLTITGKGKSETVIQTFASPAWINLPRGSTVIVDHCLFENCNFPNTGEIIVMKIGGYTVRFSTFVNIGEYLEFRAAGNGEIRSCWFENNGGAIKAFGPNHLIIGNRFVNEDLWIASGNGDWENDRLSGNNIGRYAPATNNLVVGNQFDGNSVMHVGGYWPGGTTPPQSVPADGNTIEATTPESAVVLDPTSQTDTTVNPTTTVPYTSAVKLTASDVGLNALDPLCASGKQR